MSVRVLRLSRRWAERLYPGTQPNIVSDVLLSYEVVAIGIPLP